MNERIRELIEQAGITTNLDTDYYEKDINKWVDYYSVKLAELIVHDCLDIVDREVSGMVGVHAMKAIAEHFGVE
jgi:hypothetical protein